jgi:hypothetical protein
MENKATIHKRFSQIWATSKKKKLRKKPKRNVLGEMPILQNYLFD